MIQIDLNKDWKAIKNQISDFDFEIPQQSEIINLPYDMLVTSPRAYNSVCGKFNGYYNSAILILYKELENLPKHTKAILDFHGVLGTCDVYLNGKLIKIISSACHNLIDITNDLSDKSKNIIKLVISSSGLSGKYTGLGIGGAVSLCCYNSGVAITPYGVFVKTESIDTKANISTYVEVQNESDENMQFEILAEIFNQKEKRITKKIRKVKLAKKSKKIFELPIKIGHHYDWKNYDPYIYSSKISLVKRSADLKNVTEMDSLKLNFGIATAQLSNKTLKLNNVVTKLKGAVVAQGGGILGNISELSSEMYKLSKIKNLGFNAARFIGCPSDAALEAADNLGLNLVVDLFDVWSQGDFPDDGHKDFSKNKDEIIEMSVKALRNHPSVIMYSIGNNVEESYNRADGLNLTKQIVAKIKQFDTSRIITANAFERSPTEKELASLDIKVPKNITDKKELEKKVISLAREKDLFKSATLDYFQAVDVAGYSNLYPRYSQDKLIPNRTIIGLSSRLDKMFDAIDETDKNTGVIGDFIFCAYDFIGNPQNDEKDKSLIRSHINTSGIFDITGNRKDISYYSEIVLGKKNSSYIVVEDPDAQEVSNTLADDIHLWNWPRHIGKPIKVKVYTSGDIVSLTLDGKSIGRKLAGKFNRHIAEFKTNFYPGKLEAISYHKGVEQSRAILESVTSPKMLKLICEKKTIHEGELCFLDIHITDKEGRLVPYAMRDVEVQVTEDGELIATGNGDPKYANSSLTVTPVYNGIAHAIIRGTKPGKVSVKVVCEGLLSNKATIKVK